MQPTDSTAPHHLGFLDGMRAFAALFVVCHHCMLQVWSQGSTSREAQFIIGLLKSGRSAVDVFIVLSGFCLALPVVNTGGYMSCTWLVFLKKRTRRIVLPYYCALAFSLVMIALFIGSRTGTHWDVCIPVTTRSILYHLLLIQDLNTYTTPNINHVFWSISVEYRIYFIFPLIVIGWRRFGPWVTSLIVALVAYSIVLFNMAVNRPFYYNFVPQYFILFALGCLTCLISQSPAVREAAPGNLKRGGIILLSVVILVLVTGRLVTHHSVAWLAARMYYMLCVQDLMTGTATMVILFIAMNSPTGWINRFFSWRPLAFTGTFSYSIYLIHAPLLQFIQQYGLNGGGMGLHATHKCFWFTVLLAVSLPVVLICAYGFYWLFERPFTNKVRGWQPCVPPSPSMLKCSMECDWSNDQSNSARR